MKPRTLILVLIAAGASGVLGIALWVSEPSPKHELAAASGEDAPSPVARSLKDRPRLAAEPKPRRAPTGEITAEQVAEATAQLWPESEFTDEEYDQTKVEIFREFQAVSRNWTIETYTKKAARRDELSGREIYELYTYLRTCHQQPRSVAELERREERIRNSRRMARRLSAEEIDNIVEGYRGQLVRCESLPPDESLIPLMLDWLTLAAMCGFPQAQVAYHRSARWLLTQDRWGVYRHPDRVREYRRLAPAFLEAALKSGHHDSLYEYSIALRENIIFDEDPVAAYAYAWAANLARSGGNQEAREVMALLETVLAAEDVADARVEGRELCQTYCRPNV
ncbi:MAG: hypothetical protein AAGA23_11785 [Pseudomonadota bacterium]